MMRGVWRSGGCLCLLGWAVFAGAAPAEKNDAPDSCWTLVWADEFNDSGAPNPQNWTYEEGFVRNNEEQYYTVNCRENARVEKGMLVIEARKEKFRNRFYDKNSKKNWCRNDEEAQYTSAALVTDGLHAWQYGRFEFRAKLPTGKGVWPAIWMLGEDRRTVGYPKCGEIDIMEYVFNGTPKTIWATLHFPSRNSQNKNPRESRGGKIKSDTLVNDFHIYAFEWYKDRMDFFFDNEKYFSVQMSDIGPHEPFHKKFYLLLNLAVGGGWGGTVDPAIFPQQFLIDYVRIYQFKEEVK